MVIGRVEGRRGAYGVAYLLPLWERRGAVGPQSQKAMWKGEIGGGSWS